MCLRWTAAGMLEAERQFRKIIGVGHLAKLTLAVERDVAARRAPSCRPRPSRPLRSRPRTDHRTATAKFHGDRDILPATAGPTEDGRSVQFYDHGGRATADDRRCEGAKSSERNS
jgi:hypothetical protein